MDRTVGVIGLGIMGGAIARNLRERGWRVVGIDVDPERRAALAADGIEIVPDAGSIARQVPIILTSLPNPRALQSVSVELAAAAVPRRIVVELSTFTVDDKLAFAVAMEAAGHVPLDCPLSGTGAQAAVRDLVVYASGDRTAADSCGHYSPISPRRRRSSAHSAMAAG
jgi:3-hydroxyisobutyrate dehydrogenase-like beta-hydroxyacid dehydrogenase